MLKTNSKMLLLVGFLNILFHGTARTQSCQYNHPSVKTIAACQGSGVMGGNVNVYHEMKQAEPYATSCKCAVNISESKTARVILSNVPGQDCGSSMTITKIDGTHQHFHCRSNEGNIGDLRKAFSIAFLTNADTSFSIFCVYIEALNSATVTVACGSTLSTTTSTATLPSETPTTATATTTMAEITTRMGETTSTSKPTVKTTAETTLMHATSTLIIRRSKSITSTSVQTIGQTASRNVTNTEITTEKTEQSTYKPTGFPKATKSESNARQLPLHVIIPAVVGGGVVLVILIVIIVVFMRKRNIPKNNSKANTQGIDSNSTDGDEMKVNILYESYDDVPKNNKQNTVLDDIRGGYSEVGPVQAAENHHIEGDYSEIELHSPTSKHGDGGFSEVEIPSKDKEILKSGDISGAYDEVKLPSNRTEPRNDTKPSKIDDSVIPHINQDFPVYSMPNKVPKEKSNVEQTTEPFPVYALPDKTMKPNDKGQSSREAVKPNINKTEPRNETKASNIDNSVTPNLKQDFPVYSMPNKVSKEKSNVKQTTEPFPVYALPNDKTKRQKTEL